jgi:hypothetical protein
MFQKTVRDSIAEHSDLRLPRLNVATRSADATREERSGSVHVVVISFGSQGGNNSVVISFIGARKSSVSTC